MYYKMSGEGQVVLLLHGWGTNSKYMDFIFEALKDQYCVINVDLPGFGNSELDEVYGIHDYANKLYELMCELKLENIIIVAHSFGARIAFEYALNYSCKALFLTGAAGIKAPLTNKQKWNQFLYKHARWLKKNWGSKDYQQASDLMKQVLVKCIMKDYREDLKQIKIPIGLFWGSEDRQTPLWMMEQMVEAMPQAYVRVIKGADHYGYIEHSALFLYDLKKFLKKEG